MNQFVGLVSYLACSLEKGASGTPHLQGYLETVSKITLKGLIKKCGPLSGSHLEIAKGTLSQNLTYISKECSPWIYGKAMMPGKRTDLDDVKQLIDDGATIADLWQSNFALTLQYRRGFQEYTDSRTQTRHEPPTVHIYWGTKSGTGKTRDAYALSELLGQPFVHLGGLWFDGYTSQKLAIFDEFDGSDFSFAFWKRITDRYAMRVPVKGSSVNWSPVHLVFTSNVDPKQWWSGERMPELWFEQFTRRVSRIENYDEKCAE